MEDILIALTAQHAQLAELVDACANDDWERPTRCEGWDIASVLAHLALTDEGATASARGEFDHYDDGLLGTRERQTVSVDDAAAAQVEAVRAEGGEEIRRRWHDASERMRAVFQAGDPHTRVTWVAGKLSLQTLATTRLSECWIHTDDIADALGIELQPTDRLHYIARLAWRTLPYAFQRADVTMHGPVAMDLIGPHGEQWHFDPDGPAAHNDPRVRRPNSARSPRVASTRPRPVSSPPARTPTPSCAWSAPTPCKPHDRDTEPVAADPRETPWFGR